MNAHYSCQGAKHILACTGETLQLGNHRILKLKHSNLLFQSTFSPPDENISQLSVYGDTALPSTTGLQEGLWFKGWKSFLMFLCLL